MKYLVEFRVEAQKDILEATAWYEKNREGLGDEFLIQLKTKSILLNKIHIITKKNIKESEEQLQKGFPTYCIIRLNLTPRFWFMQFCT